MSYIWEKPNLGNNLYEMAFNQRKAMLESDGELTKEDKPEVEQDGASAEEVASEQQGTQEQAGASTQEGTQEQHPDGPHLELDVDRMKAEQQEEQIDNVLSGKNSKEHIRPYTDKDKKEFATKVIDSLNYPEPIKEQLVKFVDNIIAGNDINGEKPKSEDRVKFIKRVNESLIDEHADFMKAFLKKYGDALNDKMFGGVLKEIKKLNCSDELKQQTNTAVQNLYSGKWCDGTPLDQMSKQIQEISQKAIARLQSKQSDQIGAQITALAQNISNGRIKVGEGDAPKDGIKVDDKNEGLYRKEAQSEKVKGSIEMPALFKSEPDDSMWQDIVVTAFGIPMINMGNPVSKKVLTSENPEEECPGDLKQFKKAVYSDPRLQNVFGKGGFERVIAGKLINLLTLGVAAATTDAGKRADRIIKELKEKGGMTTHRNLLMVNYEDIIDVDPDNEEITVTAKAYNRSRGDFVGEIEVPAVMLAEFYSAVDPIESPKIYMEMYNKDDTMKEKLENAGAEADAAGAGEGEGSADAKEDPSKMKDFDKLESRHAVPGRPMYESFALAGAAAAAAAGTAKQGISGELKGDNEDSNKVSKIKKNDGSEFAKMKENYIKMLSAEGHPPAYVLKPKSANKEVVVVSKSSTGQFQKGKVLMVTMKIGDNQAAAFMTPKECKQYFAL